MKSGPADPKPLAQGPAAETRHEEWKKRAAKSTGTAQAWDVTSLLAESPKSSKPSTPKKRKHLASQEAVFAAAKGQAGALEEKAS